MVHFHWIQIYFNLPYIFIRLSLYMEVSQNKLTRYVF